MTPPPLSPLPKHPKVTKFIITNISVSLLSITSDFPCLLKHFQAFLQKSKKPRRSPKKIVLFRELPTTTTNSSNNARVVSIILH